MGMKLLILSILVSFLPVLCISGIALRSATNELETSVLKSNVVFSTLTKEQLSTYFNERRGDGKVIAESENVINGLKTPNQSKALIDFLKLIESEYQYSNIFITNSKGIILVDAKNNADIKKANISTEPYIEKALKGVQNWSPLKASKLFNDNVIILSTPVYDSRVIVGTVNIVINQSLMNSIVHQGVSELGQSGDAYLINETGMLLTETRLGQYTKDAAQKISIDTDATNNLAAPIHSANTDYSYTGTYEDYLHLTRKNPNRKTLVKLRISNHKLLIETGDITMSPEVTDYALFVGIMLKMKPIFYFIVQDIHHLETTFSVK